jgi:hypothetical protein
MPQAGFETEIPESELPQAHTLFRAETGIGVIVYTDLGSVQLQKFN